MHIGGPDRLPNAPANRFVRMLRAPLVRRSAVNAQGTPDVDNTAAMMYSPRTNSIFVFTLFVLAKPRHSAHF